MEKALFREKVDAMIPDLIEGIRKECSRLYDCGGIEPGEWEDNYILPKTILCVAIESQIIQYKPLSKEGIKAQRNLRHF